MAGSPQVHVAPAPGKTCPLPMGAGNLPADGAIVCFDNHWRLMVKTGLALRTDLGERGSEVKNVQRVLADRAAALAERLKAKAKAAILEAEDAIDAADAAKKLADETDAQTKKRIAAEIRDRKQREKRAKADAEREAKAKAKKAKELAEKIKAAGARETEPEPEPEPAREEEVEPGPEPESEESGNQETGEGGDN